MSEQGMLLPGQRLRAEREARGLSQEEMAGRLNLTVTFLDALETDDYERLPEATFVRGYIRNYARELDLPGDELVSVFAEIMRENETVPETVEVMPPRRRRWAPVAAVVVVLVVAAAVVLWQQQQSAGADTPGDEVVTDNADKASAKTSDAGASEPGSEGGAEAGSDPKDSDASGAEPATGQPGAEETTPDTAPETETALADASGSASGEATAADQLEMSFSDECWLEVRDATGKVVFEGRRNAGVALTVSGQAPFELRIGDASAVSALRVNDEQQTVPGGRSGQVVRLSVP